MIRSQMRTRLRRRLLEDVADRFNDVDDLNPFLDLGVQEVQKRLLAIEPEATKTRDGGDLVAGQDFYALPPDLWRLMKLETSADGVTYSKVTRITDRQADAGDVGFVLWSRSYVRLNPAPTANVVNGLRITHISGMRMPTDATVCPLPDDLHMLAVKCAHKLALADLGEPTDRLDAEIAADFNSIPLYSEGSAESTKLELDFPQEYDAYR